jgi:NRPS condensation-like uncharacterized protein
MQQGMLFHSELDKSAYVTQLMFTLEAEVDMSAFHQAWQQVLNRHDILKTVFVTAQSGELQQLVLRDVTLPWTQVNLASLNKKEQQAQIESDRQSDKSKGFELHRGPLIRIHVWDLTQGRYQILLSDHHALTDGWSMPIIFSEVQQIYQSILLNQKATLKQPVAYSQYISWLARQDESLAIDFWQKELSGINGATTLPQTQGKESTKQHIVQLDIDEKLNSQLQKLAKDAQVTLNSILQAAWSYLLANYSQQSTVVFGTTVSGRPAQLKNVEQMVGLFINTIPVRVDIKFDLPFKQWLKTLHAKQVERNEYSYLPLVEIQKLVNNNHNTPLIDSLFVYENYPSVKQAQNSSKQQQLTI